MTVLDYVQDMLFLIFPLPLRSGCRTPAFINYQSLSIYRVPTWEGGDAPCSWLVALKGARLTVGGKAGRHSLERTSVSRVVGYEDIILKDVTRDNEGARFEVELGGTTVTVETRDSNRVVIDDGETEIEIWLEHEDYAPSAVRVDGMSLWTS